ncbi:mucin-2-like isoform X2 [Hyla sarda]|uniref:mucin-2-like isoform X2 n=1 Tax=Hyla sarda TaxID=327740 RepID=UPI0024C32154|nr:mucin-2-like isoform X2 [Hyla sarda]
MKKIVQDAPGLGVREKEDSPSVSSPWNICMINALKDSQELLLQLATLMCTYEKGMEKLNSNNWESFYQTFKEILEHLVCEFPPIVEDTTSTTSNVTLELLKTLRPVLDKSGLSELAFATLCKVTEKFLEPTCLPLLLGGDVPLLLIDLATQACPGINKKVAYDDLLSIVKRTSCLLTDAPLDLDELVKDISQKNDVGDLIFSGSAEPIGDLIVNVLCVAAKILLPDLSPVTCEHLCTWSQWFDVNYPKYEPNGGDDETYENIENAGYKVCEKESWKTEDTSCRAQKYPDIHLDQLGQIVTCDVSTGLTCKNQDQTGFMHVCLNYEISFYCCSPDCISTTSQTTTSPTTTITETTLPTTTITETTSPTTTITETTSPTTTITENTSPTTTIIETTSPSTTIIETTSPSTTITETTSPTTTIIETKRIQKRKKW